MPHSNTTERTPYAYVARSDQDRRTAGTGASGFLLVDRCGVGMSGGPLTWSTISTAAGAGRQGWLMRNAARLVGERLGNLTRYSLHSNSGYMIVHIRRHSLE